MIMMKTINKRKTEPLNLKYKLKFESCVVYCGFQIWPVFISSEFYLFIYCLFIHLIRIFDEAY